MKFIEVNQIGGLKIDKISINVDSITSIQQPREGHCIIATDDGQKYLVDESYDDIINIIKKIAKLSDIY